MREPEFEAYRNDLAEVARAEGVEGHVVFAGKVSLEELAAYYRVADLFVCMSEHEGFCAPLVEAMAHDLPVLARAEGAVPETLGDAGVLVRGRCIPEIAETAAVLVGDARIRADVVARQRARLGAFGREPFERALASFVQSL